MSNINVCADCGSPRVWRDRNNAEHCDDCGGACRTKPVAAHIITHARYGHTHAVAVRHGSKYALAVWNPYQNSYQCADREGGWGIGRLAETAVRNCARAVTYRSIKSALADVQMI